MPKITLPQKNIILEVAPSANLMASLREYDIPVASSCLGDGICGKCQMVIVGDVKEPAEVEIQTLQRNKISIGSRLSCQIAVTSDLTVTTTYW